MRYDKTYDKQDGPGNNRTKTENKTRLLITNSVGCLTPGEIFFENNRTAYGYETEEQINGIKT